MKNNSELVEALKLVVTHYYDYPGEVTYATLCNDLNELLNEKQSDEESETKDEE